jgi:hypothetical protein
MNVIIIITTMILMYKLMHLKVILIVTTPSPSTVGLGLHVLIRMYPGNPAARNIGQQEEVEIPNIR